MTTEQWLTVAMVIAVIMTALATFFGPILAVIVQWRISQPKPKPEANQPKNRIQRIGGLLKKNLKSFGFLYVAFVLNVITLVSLASGTEPISRKTVVTMAVCVGLAYFQVTLLLIAWLIERMDKHMSYWRNFQPAHFNWRKPCPTKPNSTQRGKNCLSLSRSVSKP